MIGPMRTASVSLQERIVIADLCPDHAVPAVGVDRL
jgi:hypothetical protein